MNPKHALSFLVQLLLALLPVWAAAESSSVLTLDSYLQQTRTGNEGAQGAMDTMEGSQLRSKEGTLLVAPSAFVNTQLASDAKKNAFFPYDSVTNNVYSLGIVQNTTFGLQGRVYYTLNYWNYQGFRPAIPSYYEGRPAIELNQSLWRNGFGAETRATQDLLEANALATHFGESFRLKSILSDAEMTYWRLALARETVKIQRDALERAQKIRDWSSRRVRLHLADQSDLLQAQAAMDLRSLQLEQARNEERAASLAFNQARGIGADNVAEALEPPDAERAGRIRIPEVTPPRDDVKAAQQLERATRANATASTQRDLPTFDLFASYALNSQNTGLGQSVSDSFGADRPTKAIGFKFSTPLDFGSMSDSRKGWQKEQAAAEHNYQRRLFDQKREWEDLIQRFRETRANLALARSIEEVQQKKLANEKDRLNHGRTTTYQVLLFEQDYSQSQLSRIQTEAAILQLVARMKLFGDNQL
jgi:outer membrane protein TolC